jgi:hypothetical protein
VDTAQRRGAIEHYYKAVVRPFFSDRDWKRLPRPGRQAISDVALRVIWEDVSAALKAGTFDQRADRHLSHNDVELDEKGWQDASKVLAKALDDVEKIASASAARLKKSGSETIPATVVAMQFESPARHAQES